MLSVLLALLLLLPSAFAEHTEFEGRVAAGPSLSTQSSLYQGCDASRSYGTSLMVSTIRPVHQVGKDVDIGLSFRDSHQSHGGFVHVLAVELGA